MAQVDYFLKFDGIKGESADATLFLWQDAGTSSALSNPRVGTFVFAGIQGRLDTGGTSVGTTTTTSYRPEDY